jgi:hypothetical protein
VECTYGNAHTIKASASVALPGMAISITTTDVPAGKEGSGVEDGDPLTLTVRDDEAASVAKECQESEQHLSSQEEPEHLMHAPGAVPFGEEREATDGGVIDAADEMLGVTEGSNVAVLDSEADPDPVAVDEAVAVAVAEAVIVAVFVFVEVPLALAEYVRVTVGGADAEKVAVAV